LSSPENPQFGTPPLSAETPPVSVVTEPSPLPAYEPTPPSPKSGENPIWSGWDVLQIAGLTLATLFVTQLLIVLAARHFVFPRASFLEVAQKPALALLSQLLGYAVVAIFMFLLIEGKYRVRFWPAIRWNWPRSVWPWLGIGVMLFVVMGLMGRLLPMPESTPLEEFYKHPRDAYLTSIFAITLGPLMEELFFRGFLYPVLARRMGIAWGIFFTALPFGLMHMFEYGYAWGIVLIIFLVGIVCTAVRARTGSVAASFIVHVAYNATDMFLIAAATGGFRHMEKAVIVLSRFLR
jgi:uncharacterized protein